METNLLDDEGGLAPRGLPSGPASSAPEARCGRPPQCWPLRASSAESTFRYHYERGNDERLVVVVSGRPSLRTPEGERELAAGDCVLCPSGPDGAHQVTNRSDGPARILLVSNFALACGGAGRQQQR